MKLSQRCSQSNTSMRSRRSIETWIGQIGINHARSGPPGSHLTKAGASPNPSDKILIEKVLGTVLDMKRVMNEEFMTITQKINSLDEKMKSCTCNCTMEKSS